MRKILAGLVTGMALIATAAAADDILTAGDLRDAIRGDGFSYRGVMRDGDSAIAFAEGYVAALSTITEWCDPGIAPHEVLARVYDRIDGLEAEAQDQPAEVAVAQTLQQLGPCNEDGQSE
ncbi:hypothetical protein [Paracoccus fistulariae]|uniref:Rap1a immunity protein domain-containing protein n=1 Tax=Paracoccus fistulariae TaxID=658446 RepID=A0ABY7SI48_9RHOB|nr:hypothetical protein [Paracoccus fistulariae]MDB6180910.1 hypothetical protein [Paracoccus fistulariae]WCR06207.1 hypothetical protein JHX87_11970 [Paracoccus fistulariae]